MSYDVALTDQQLLAIMAAIIYAGANSDAAGAGATAKDAVVEATEILDEVAAEINRES